MRVALIVASLVLGAMLPVHADGGFGGPRPSSGASVEAGPTTDDGASVGGGLGEPVGAPGDPSIAPEAEGYPPQERLHPPQIRVRPPRRQAFPPRERRSVAEAQATADVDGVWRDPRIAVPSRVSEPGSGFDPSLYRGYYGYPYGGSHGKGGAYGGYSHDEGRVPIPESFKSWRAWTR